MIRQHDGFDDAPTSNQYPDVVEVSYNDGVTPKLTTGYDRLGRVESLALGEGATNVLGKQLHPSGMLLGESYSGGPLAGFNLTNTLDAVLRRQTLAARNGTNVLGLSLTFGYDEGGRLQSVSDGTYSATYAYVAYSPLWETLTFKQNGTPRATTTRQFDFLDRLQSISTVPAGASANPLAFAYAYNLANQRVRRTDPDTGYWVYEYDDLGQVISGRKHWSDGTPVAGQQFEYAYDDIGNRTATAEGGNENGNSLRSAAYTPNSLNQYSSRTVPSSVDVLGVGTPAATLTVNGGGTYRKGEYFRAQLVVTNASGPIATPVTVNANSGATNTTTTGQVLTPPVNQNFEYDLDGNLINDLVWSYTWDGENRLLAMEALATVADCARAKVSWEYDPAGRRIRQTVATNWTGSAYSVTNEIRMVYDGWACIAELNSAGTLQRQYAWGLDLSGTTTGAGGVGGYLWMRPSGGAAHFAAHDGNGNVAALVDGSSGMVSARYDYEPFGRTLRLTGTGTIAKDNPFRFSSKRAEDTTAIILYEYRPYSPSLARWPNRDPIGEKGGASLYVYARNAAPGSIDALGLSTMWLDPSIQPISDPISTSQSNPNAPRIYGATSWKFFSPRAYAYRPIPSPTCACQFKIHVGGNVQVQMFYVSWAPAARRHEMIHVDDHFRAAFDAFRENSDEKASRCYDTKEKADCVATVIMTEMRRAYMLQALAAGAVFDRDEYGMPLGSEQRNYEQALLTLNAALEKCSQLK